jgi:hypothetical protein
MATTHGWLRSLEVRRALSSSYDNKVKQACRRLALMGYVDVTVGVLQGARHSSSSLVTFPTDLRGIADSQFVMVYAGTSALREAYYSGALKEQLVDNWRERSKVPVNERVLRKLIELHPDSIKVKDLKAVAGVSESNPELAKRLEYLAKKDWVSVEVFMPGHFRGEGKYWHGGKWSVQLSAGGWLRVQQAANDGKQLVFPKPEPKKKKKEPVEA